LIEFKSLSLVTIKPQQEAKLSLRP